MPKILASSQENSIDSAIAELNERFKVLKVEKLTNNVFICEINESFDNILSKLSKDKTIFIRYIMPVLLEDKILENKVNFSNILKTIPFEKTGRFAFHLTILNNDTLNKQNIIEEFSAYFKENNLFVDPKNADKIINLTVNGDTVYFGVSSVESSLSSWAFGECHFRERKGQISRAEFKLLEALECFNIDLSNCKTALDLGAAPGGWTAVLLNKGLKVIAVDPAKLDRELLLNENLLHYQGVSQDYLYEYYTDKYDIIVNDMKMNSKQSIEVMEEAAKCLNSNGLIVMTLKLNPTRNLEEVKECLELLKNKYRIIGARQLFYNRSEVTLLFQNL